MPREKITRRQKNMSRLIKERYLAYKEKIKSTKKK